jgi:hypothetical protein
MVRPRVHPLLEIRPLDMEGISCGEPTWGGSPDWRVVMLTTFAENLACYEISQKNYFSHSKQRKTGLVFLWDATPCSDVRYQRFGGPCCLCLYPEHGDSMVITTQCNNPDDHDMNLLRHKNLKSRSRKLDSSGSEYGPMVSFMNTAMNLKGV